MRALDPVGIDRNATGGTATGNPNEFTLLDLTPILSRTPAATCTRCRDVRTSVRTRRT